MENWRLWSGAGMFAAAETGVADKAVEVSTRPNQTVMEVIEIVGLVLGMLLMFWNGKRQKPK